jgi:23S rRNA G2445 N2-methylase RlmL
MPPELIIFGEEAILDSLQEQPPGFIAIVHKDTSEYGYHFFGSDYGQKIMRWARQNYRALGVIGAPPLQDDRFGILLLERSELP